MKLPGQVLSPSLSTPEREVLLIEALPCEDGDRFSLTFESAEPRWRQGVWLAVDGELAVADVLSPQLVLWRDSVPSSVDIEVRSAKDRLLSFYNVWDSGRGRRRESQSHSSGMVREGLEGGGFRYRCSDISPAPTYGALVFTLEVVGRSG